jgi:ketosteroid isomerase-like protein
MGRARELWEALGAAMEQQDLDTVLDLYAPDAVWLEPQNPPHETNRLIQAYLSDWLKARDHVEVTTKRLLESDDGTMLAAEWTITYDAAGRRWRDLPRSSWLESDGDVIRYHRDYF